MKKKHCIYIYIHIPKMIPTNKYYVIYRNHISHHYWLVVEPTPLKNMSSSVGMIIPNIWRNDPNVQTTNQI